MLDDMQWITLRADIPQSRAKRCYLCSQLIAPQQGYHEDGNGLRCWPCVLGGRPVVRTETIAGLRIREAL